MKDVFLWVSISFYGFLYTSSYPIVTHFRPFCPLKHFSPFTLTNCLPQNKKEASPEGDASKSQH